MIKTKKQTQKAIDDHIRGVVLKIEVTCGGAGLPRLQRVLAPLMFFAHTVFTNFGQTGTVAMNIAWFYCPFSPEFTWETIKTLKLLANSFQFGEHTSALI